MEPNRVFCTMLDESGNRVPHVRLDASGVDIYKPGHGWCHLAYTDEGTVFMPLEDAIEWHESESAKPDYDKRYDSVVKALRDALWNYREFSKCANPN